LTPVQAPLAQLTVHELPPQTTPSLHASCPHSMVHDSAPLAGHATLPAQEFAPVHSIRQLKSSGHWISSGHASSVSHVNTQAPSWHVAPAAAHAAWQSAGFEG